MSIFDSWSDDDNDEPYIIGKVPLSGWKAQFGRAEKVSGSSVTITKTSEPHYFMRPIEGIIRAKKLIVEGTVTGESQDWLARDTEDRWVPCNNPTFRPMIRKRGDDLTKEWGRFWTRTGVDLLKTSGKFSLSTTISYVDWSAVFGKTQRSAFDRIKNDVGWVGITFGGISNYGHGLRSSKPVTVKITRFEFK